MGSRSGSSRSSRRRNPRGVLPFAQTSSDPGGSPKIILRLLESSACQQPAHHPSIPSPQPCSGRPCAALLVFPCLCGCSRQRPRWAGRRHVRAAPGWQAGKQTKDFGGRENAVGGVPSFPFLPPLIQQPCPAPRSTASLPAEPRGWEWFWVWGRSPRRHGGAAAVLVALFSLTPPCCRGKGPPAGAFNAEVADPSPSYCLRAPGTHGDGVDPAPGRVFFGGIPASWPPEGWGGLECVPCRAAGW